MAGWEVAETASPAACIQAKAAALPEAGPGSIGHLDGDTAISRGTFAAALAAAGSVCQAVDAVVTKQVRTPLLAVYCAFGHAVTALADR